MSFYEAKHYVDDNRRLIGRPAEDEDKLIWNLSTGLSFFASALENELSLLHSELKRISQSLRRLE